MNDTFTRDDTKAIKGIAIILMLMHHLWAFPERIAGGGLKCLITIMSRDATVFFGSFGKICVSLFFFLGGYGIYVASRGKKFDPIGKIKQLYLSYWKAFFIMIPIAFLFFGNQPVYCRDAEICTRYDSFNLLEFLNNVTGINATYNGEWWFLKGYVFAVITFPLVRHICDKHKLSVNIALVVAASILTSNFLPNLGYLNWAGTLINNNLYRLFLCESTPYIACFWMGIAVAKDDVLNRIKESMTKHKLLNPFLDIVIWVGIIYMRQIALGESFDIFYIPFLIVASMDLLSRVLWCRRLLIGIGRQSTNMWLTHSFLCYYFYSAVKIVVAPRWALPSLLCLIVFSYLVSILITMFWKAVNKIWLRVSA